MRWEVGDVIVTKVVEMELVGLLERVLPDLTPEVLAPFPWLKPHFVTEEGALKLSIHALVIETPTKRILVDTCFGNDKQGRAYEFINHLQGSFLHDLAAVGYPRESIDVVLCTHLHVDHVGWNTMLVEGAWTPTFPNARYLMARREFEHWRTQTDIERQITVFADSVQPVVDAGLVDLVDENHRVCEEVRLFPTPGHSPGHVSVQIASRGQHAVITGDVVHHPGQIAIPDCGSLADDNVLMAVATRRKMLEELAGGSTLMIGTHFTTPTAGRLVRDGDSYRLLV